jgi:hypothetical protein
LHHKTKYRWDKDNGDGIRAKKKCLHLLLHFTGLTMNDDSETRKWILKQGEYRRLYSSLLQKHRGALQTTNDGATDSENDPFVEESGIMINIFRTEAKNIVLGTGAVVASMASLRFIRSKHAISTVFGRTKAEAMRDAEAEGQRMGTDAFQRTFGAYNHK